MRILEKDWNNTKYKAQIWFILNVKDHLLGFKILLYAVKFFNLKCCISDISFRYFRENIARLFQAPNK